MTIAVCHDFFLLLDVNLIFNSLTDEQRGLNYAGQYSGWRIIGIRGNDFQIFRSDGQLRSDSDFRRLRARQATVYNGVTCAIDQNAYSLCGIGGLDRAAKKQGLADEVTDELIRRMFVELPSCAFLLHYAGPHEHDSIG